MAVAPSHHDDAPALASGLYERHAGTLHAYCRARLRNRDDADEAVQATYLRALRALQRGVRPEFERAWLLTIARNVCVTQATSAHSRREVVHDPASLDGGEVVTLPDLELDPELLAALDALPDGQRRAFVLRAVDGLSYEEIAGELGVTHAAVETWIFRARRKLAAAMGERRRRLSADLASLGTALKSLVAGGAAVKGGAAAAVALLATTAVVAVPHAGDPGPAPARPPASSPAPPLADAPPVPPPSVEAPARPSPSERRTHAPRTVAPSATTAPPAAESAMPSAPPPVSPPPSAAVEPPRPLAPAVEAVEDVVAPVLPALETPPLPALPPLPQLPPAPPVDLPPVPPLPVP